MASKEQIREMMRSFVSGTTRTMALAGEIEVGLEELFGEQEPFASVALALASYRPGGGEFLYDDAEMVRMMQQALDALEAE